MPSAPARPLRVLIVDDEPLARRRIAQLLAGEAGLQVAGECGDARAALVEIERERPDLLFLDVQMPEVSGLELLPLVPPERMPEIVFVTAHDEFAVAAFELQAVDYLLKPFTETRFREALRRARARIAAAGGREHLATLARELARAPRERMLVREGDRVIVLRTADIDYVEAQDYYACVRVGAASHLVRESLKQLEATLDPQRFVRVHRSYLVNLERIEAVQPIGGGEQRLILRDGARLPVGPSYARVLLDALAR